MGMQIEKSVVVHAPIEAVWAFLTDPRKVASCLPGAAITDQVDETTYGGTITVKVGPVTASYRGKMTFERLDVAAREAEIAASGQETRGKGAADMRMKSRLVAKGPNETEVVITSDVNVVGVLAQFGRGMIQDVSDQMFGKFSTAMRSQLEGTAAPAPAAAATAAAAPAATAAASGGAPAGATGGGAGASAATPATAASGSATSAAPSAGGASAQPAPAPSGGGTAAQGAAPAGASAAADTPAAAAVSPAGPSTLAPPAPSTPTFAASAASAAGAPPRASEEVLDLGAIGAAAAGRAAGRVLRNPVFWIVVAAVAATLWFLLR